MEMKSVVAVASGESGDERTLRATARLAAGFFAHVEVVPAFPNPAADLVYYGATLSHAPQASAIDRIVESQRDTQEKLEAIARDIAAQEGLHTGAGGPGPTIHVDQRGLAPAVALADAAALADLVVFGAAGVRDLMGLGSLFAETLLTTRAPALLVKTDEIELDAVAVAWDGSLQAARAVRASLPFLKRATTVFVLTNTDDEAADVEAAGDARLRRVLGEHGIDNVKTCNIAGVQVGESLLKAAIAEKCGLLVAGGYGRPRLFELVLGGTTRALVRAEGGPNILLAH